MDWVYKFYLNQNKWTGLYRGGVEDNHRENAELVRKFAREKQREVLELGAGGGQNAAALAELGYSVTAVELIPELAEIARKFTRCSPSGKIEVIQGDFYEVDFKRKFDIIVYWDGFGIGSDDDQGRLLKKIDNWLKDDGFVLIEVYNPIYWKKVVGKTMKFGNVIRRYDYDFLKNRMLDQWWIEDCPEESVSQSLRCYTPDDLKILLSQTGLKLKSVQYPDRSGQNNQPDKEMMQYLVKLVN